MQSMLLFVSRRRHIVSFAVMLLLLSLQNGVYTSGTVARSCRRLSRNAGWWETVWTQYTNRRFKKTFRVSRETFQFILGKIHHRLVKETKVEDPVSPELRLAICLYRLGRGDYYYTIAEMVGLGVSTVCSIVQEVTAVIVEEMWDSSITKHMPKSDEDFKTKMIDMETMWQFPCCWAAIDGCHIPIKCPPGGLESCKEYHNFKNFYSIVLMGMVDSNYRFVWGSCGFPGNSHDAVIFQSTNIWEKIQSGEYIPQIGKKESEIKIPPLIIGDSAFPLCTWLMKPYTQATLTPQQRYFNYRLSRARMVTEGAYGQLKGRWRVLLRKCESSREELRTTTLACMVLHNVCIEKGDSLSKKLDITVDPQTQGRRDRQEVRQLLQMRERQKVRDSPAEANKVRNVLCQKLWQEKTTGNVC